MTDHLKEKYDNALDDIDHTFDADDRNAIVGQLITMWPSVFSAGLKR